tara:strand:+ start:1279 stop:1950 length:672 start_codon:yes stop_codon:yes gene_type:complete
MINYSKLYPDSYFLNRNLNDPKRIATFKIEKKLIEKYSDKNGIICDVGCSTGEFLSILEWNGKKYGMEINEEAKKKALKNKISFDKNIFTAQNFFDVVVFRGTIQHLPTPFLYIQKTYEALKSNGLIIFLSTPNANSICYKYFNTLPALDPKLNFYEPSDITLSNVLKNFNFEILETKFPYFNSPYSSLIKDHFEFCKSIILNKKNIKFPFWKNMMNMIARKK